MLNLLSNKTHQVITGIAIIRLPEYRILTDAEKTLVTFRKLTEKEIATYIESKEPYDKAGAYALQGKAGLFVKHINGCYLNVIGLPVNLLLAMLKKLNWQPENSG
jgi:septum formation protein